MATNLNPRLPPTTIWYKTKSGKIFLGVLGVIFFAGLGFVTLSTFYFIQIKGGDGNALAERFNSGLTLANNTKSSRETITEDIRTYVHPDSPKLGSDDAPVTILIFIDFECPYCQAAYPDFKAVTEKYDGLIQVVFKHFPIAYIHPNSNNAALAAMCANEQKTFWPYYDKLFENNRLNKNSLLKYAKELNLNKLEFERCFEGSKYQKAIDTDLQDVQTLGVRGTPTYFVNKQKLEGVTDLDTWDEVIIQELTQNK